MAMAVVRLGQTRCHSPAARLGSYRGRSRAKRGILKIDGKRLKDELTGVRGGGSRSGDFTKKPYRRYHHSRRGGSDTTPWRLRGALKADKLRDLHGR